MREVARMLQDRRDYPVLEVVEALGPLAQPELLDTEQQSAEVEIRKGGAPEMQMVLTPEPRALEG
jgi:hypothetical protein